MIVALVALALAPVQEGPTSTPVIASASDRDAIADPLTDLTGRFFADRPNGPTAVIQIESSEQGWRGLLYTAAADVRQGDLCSLALTSALADGPGEMRFKAERYLLDPKVPLPGPPSFVSVIVYDSGARVYDHGAGVELCGSRNGLTGWYARVGQTGGSVIRDPNVRVAAPPYAPPLYPPQRDPAAAIIVSSWIVPPQPIFPEGAIANGVRDARTILECEVVSWDRLEECHVVAEEPPGMGFGAASIAAAANAQIGERTAEAAAAGQKVRFSTRYRTVDEDTDSLER